MVGVHLFGVPFWGLFEGPVWGALFGGPVLGALFGGPVWGACLGGLFWAPQNSQPPGGPRGGPQRGAPHFLPAAKRRPPSPLSEAVCLTLFWGALQRVSQKGAPEGRRPSGTPFWDTLLGPPLGVPVLAQGVHQGDGRRSWNSSTSVIFCFQKVEKGVCVSCRSTLRLTDM